MTEKNSKVDQNFHGGVRDSASIPANVLLENMVLTQAASLARDGYLNQAENTVRPLIDSIEQPLPESLDLMAKILAQQGKLEEARSVWERALRLEPGNERYLAAIERCRYLQDRGIKVQIKYNNWSWKPLLVSFVALAALSVILVQNVRLLGEVQGLSEEVVLLSDSVPTEPELPLDIEIRVEEALKSDERTAALPLTVISEQNVVRIVGQTPGVSSRYLVEQLARDVEPVYYLDLGDLDIADGYQVERGDTLWSISNDQYSSPLMWEDLARFNSIPPPYTLQVGQEVFIPQLKDISK